MRFIKLSSLNVAALLLIAVLCSSLLTYTFVGAVTGEIEINETSILLTDGTNPMLADLDMNGYNITDAVNYPMGAYSYMIYVDPDNSSIYKAKAANGTVCWESTNISYLCTTVGSTLSTNGGGIIFAKNGQYNCSNQITQYSNTQICGEGWGTIFIMTGDSNSPLFFPSVNCENASISNLSIDGNKNEFSGIIYPYAIQLWCNVTSYKIENVNFYNTYSNAIDISSGIDVTITNCKFKSCDDDAIDIEWNLTSTGFVPENIKIIKNTIIECGRYGVLNYNGKYVQIAHNDISNLTSSVHSAIMVEEGNHTTISENIIHDNAGKGITIFTNNNTITANQIDECNGIGIYLYTANYNIISNNRLTDSPSVAQGIYLLNSSYNSLTCNNIFGTFSQSLKIENSLHNQINGGYYRNQILESGTSDYNIFSNFEVVYSLTVAGSNTKSGDFYNSTTWVAPESLSLVTYNGDLELIYAENKSASALYPTAKGLTGTESESQVVMVSSGSTVTVGLRVTANSLDNVMAFALMVNGVQQGDSYLISAGQTGVFTQNVNTSFSSGDLLSIKIWAGASTSTGTATIGSAVISIYA